MFDRICLEVPRGKIFGNVRCTKCTCKCTCTHTYLFKRNKSLLPEFGGKLELSREWGRSVLNRLNFKQRKATKGIKHLPDEFENLKAEYLERIEKTVKTYDIPDEFIINWDQTGM